ncbi:hypothetical protein [Mycolicibacterium aubagnense]|uniref:hypothetical protein n=1 Tax=Mycolicibacterium aubagnense TaxID=319707 RepID=UPI0010FF38FA|nr:hypothetical protein [Mycolicibacterium aubagnense]TLH70798.1 hypothetical protein C1S80_00595 [Mycolicibacterium aubagnense]WGI32719.1 hypothetical protein QDT91_26810 [Mycolicibacterium aubagnense]
MDHSSNTYPDLPLYQIWQKGERGSHQPVNAAQSANFRVVKIVCWHISEHDATTPAGPTNIDADGECDSRPPQVRT